MPIMSEQRSLSRERNRCPLACRSTLLQQRGDNRDYNHYKINRSPRHVAEGQTIIGRCLIFGFSQRTQPLFKASIILVGHIWSDRQLNWARKTKIKCAADDPGRELLWWKGAFKERFMNMCIFKETKAISGRYRTTIADTCTRITDRVQESKMACPLQSLKLVPEGVIKLVKPYKIHFSNTAIPGQSF